MTASVKNSWNSSRIDVYVYERVCACIFFFDYGFCYGRSSLSFRWWTFCFGHPMYLIPLLCVIWHFGIESHTHKTYNICMRMRAFVCVLLVPASVHTKLNEKNSHSHARLFGIDMNINWWVYCVICACVCVCV